MALFVSTGHRQWHDSKLKSVDQLPEIDADFIVLTWDDDDETKEIVLLMVERSFSPENGLGILPLLCYRMPNLEDEIRLSSF